jgi:peptidoglycan/xylan/chitin deacetylase (PgdA/CDA1 family)
VQVPILMYHRVDALTATLPAVTRALTVDPRTFAAQMTWLSRHGRHTITQRQLFDALMNGAPLPAHPVLITFDDGYRDVFQKAFPILRRLHMHATAYVITGRIGADPHDPTFLTWGEMRQLERGGVAVGSHTVHHLDLPSLADSQALSELVGSRRTLERRLGHPVQWLAYPAGREDARIVDLTRRAGYVLATTTEPGTVQHADDPLRLVRQRVADTTTLAEFAALVS